MPLLNSWSDAYGGTILGHLVGLGGGGSNQPSALTRFLLSQGFDLGGMTGKGYAKGSLLSSLLTGLNQPTGLEGMYGPEFQSRAVSSTLAQAGAPFAEAARALTSGYLRAGQGYGGQLMAGRAGLARGEGQAGGSAISNLLMSLEQARAGNVQNIEGIRQGRQSLLANFLNQLQTQGLGQQQLKAGQQQAEGSAIGAGAGSLLSLLGLLLL